MSPSSPGVAMRRASRKVMHEGAVRVMAEGAGGRTLPMTRGTACGRVVMAPAGKTPKMEDRRRQVEGVHGVLPGREEVVRGDVNKDTMQSRHHGRESVTKGMVKAGLTSRESNGWSDEGGEPVEIPTWAGSGME